MVIPTDPICNHEAGVLQGFESVVVHALVFERSDHALDHAVLLTVPCDAPLFPLDLATRLASAFATSNVDFAVASAPQSGLPGEPCSPQPVFCLMKAQVLSSLLEYLQCGGRKVSSWMLQHRVVFVPFDQPNDAANAFFNANTLEALQQAQLMVT